MRWIFLILIAGIVFVAFYFGDEKDGAYYAARARAAKKRKADMKAQVEFDLLNAG